MTYVATHFFPGGTKEKYEAALAVAIAILNCALKFFRFV
jgi:hypothetical protein